MFIVKNVVDASSSIRSAMLTFRPVGASALFDATDYKHCVPNGTGNCLLLTASCLLPTVPAASLA
jgi:hypothetical protein